MLWVSFILAVSHSSLLLTSQRALTSQSGLPYNTVTFPLHTVLTEIIAAWSNRAEAWWVLRGGVCVCVCVSVCPVLHYATNSNSQCTICSCPFVKGLNVRV